MWRRHVRRTVLCIIFICFVCAQFNDTILVSMMMEIQLSFFFCATRWGKHFSRPETGGFEIAEARLCKQGQLVSGAEFSLS